MKDIRLTWQKTAAHITRTQHESPEDTKVEFADFHGVPILRITYTPSYLYGSLATYNEKWYAIFNERESNVMATAESVEHAIATRTKVYQCRSVRYAKLEIASMYDEGLDKKAKPKGAVQFVRYDHRQVTGTEEEQAQRRRGDCVPRAIGYALRLEYGEIVSEIDKGMPEGRTCINCTPRRVYGKVLKAHGWRKVKLFGAYQAKEDIGGWGKSPYPSMAKVLRENPAIADYKGVLLFAQRKHLVAYDGGRFLDTWDSTSGRKVIEEVWWNPADGDCPIASTGKEDSDGDYWTWETD